MFLQTIHRSVINLGGKIVLVAGDAGMGKSTLINHFLSNLPKNDFAVAMCDPLSTPRPLGPVRDLVQALPVFTATFDPHTQDQFFDGMITALRSHEKTLVLAIEDLHWVDQRTLDWLQFIGRRISQLPLMLVGSLRDDEVDIAHPLKTALASIPTQNQVTIQMTPLSPATVSTLGQHSSISTQQLIKITGGNPFYLTELLRNNSTVGQVPTSVADVINARLNSLPDELRRTIEFLSCITGEIHYDLLHRLIDVDDANWIDPITRLHQIVTPTDKGLAFRHELVRLTAFQRVPPLQRRQYQTQILNSLIAFPNLNYALDNIVHYAQATQSVSIILQYAPMAAAKAAYFGAHKEAAAFLKIACEDHILSHAPPQQAAQLLEDWAYEAGLSIHIDDEVITARLQAIALWQQVGRNDKVGENLRWLSRAHWYRGESNQAQSYLQQALDTLENEPPAIAHAKAYALRGQYFMLQDAMQDAIHWATKAIPLAQKFNDSEIHAHALNTIGTAKMFRADISGRQELQQSLKLSIDNQLHEQAARVYTNLSECLVENRMLPQAQLIIDQGIAFDTAHDLDSWSYYLIGRKAQLRLEQDRYHEAKLIADSVLAREDQTLLMRIPALIILARCLIRTADTAATQTQELARDHAHQINEPQYLAAVLISDLEMALLQHDNKLANDTIDKLSTALPPEKLSHRKRAELTFWASLSNLPLPLAYHDEIPESFTTFFAGDYQNAAQLFKAEQSHYFAAWSLWKTQQHHLVTQAIEYFNEINAVAAIDYIHHHQQLNTPASPPQRYPIPPRTEAKPHPYGLTRKELTVLSLLVLGKSNAAIADELSRSRRTVENHVAAIFNKLDCHNRVDALLKTQSEPWILGAMS